MTADQRKLFSALHHWLGLFISPLLAIFCLTGALCTIGPALDHWMQPENQPTLTNPTPTPYAVAKAAQFMEATRGKEWDFLRLPLPLDPFFRLVHFNGHAFHIQQSLDPVSAEILPTSSSIGSGFFTALHTSFYTGGFLIDFLGFLVALCAILAIISGIFLHYRRLYSDFQLLRFASAAPRRALDFHLFACLIALPFLLAALTTALWIEGKACFEHRWQNILSEKIVESHPAIAGSPSLDDYAALFEKGREIWGNQNKGFLLMLPSGAALYPSDGKSISLTRPAIQLTQNQDGKWDISPLINDKISIDAALTGLHSLRWADGKTRWIIALSSMILWASFGAGTFLLKKKQQRLNEKSTQNPLSDGKKSLFIIGEILALTAFAILPFTIMALLWMEWLLPPKTNVFGYTRFQIEIFFFFLLWGILSLISLITLIFPALNQKIPPYLWRGFLTLTAFLAITLPAVSAIGHLLSGANHYPDRICFLLEGSFCLFGILLYLLSQMHFTLPKSNNRKKSHPIPTHKETS